MGEIATWAFIKSQTGIGYDTNECPTKKEILAYPQEGKAWDDPTFDVSSFSYQKLEVDPRVSSNFGDNETVFQTSVGYEYYRRSIKIQSSSLGSVSSNALSIPALGGTFTAVVRVGLEKLFKSGNSGVIREFKSYPFKLFLENSDTLPEYLTYSSSEPNDDGYITLTFSVSENINTSVRGPHRICVGLDNEHFGYLGYFVQEAGVETWEYTFFSQPDSLSIGAIGDDKAYGFIDSKKYQYINGKSTGVREKVNFTQTEGTDWLSIVLSTLSVNPPLSFGQTLVIGKVIENKSESSRSHIITFTQAESGKKVTITYNQAAGVKTYGDVTITPGVIPDIPASGGTDTMFSYTYSQSWGWNGKTNDGGSIEGNGGTVAIHGGTVIWSDAVSGSNLGTTPKARTKLGTRTLTLTLNSKSGTASQDVYQAANAVTKTTRGAWEVSISANPSTFTEQGGTSQISASARAPRTNTWSSGATNAASDATGTPTLSIPTAVTGFSLSGTTLTVAENTTPNDRSVVVRATMDTVYKEVTVTQSAYLVEWRYYLTTSTPTLNFDAIGATKSGTISSYREKYINGSLVEGSHEGVNIQVKSMSDEIQSATAAIAITMKENTTTQARTGTVVYEQVGSGKTVTITCSQAAGTVTTREVLGWISGIPDSIPSKGGSVSGTIQSGYWDVINGKDTTFHPVAPEVTKPNNVDVTFTKVSSTPTLGDRYNMTVSTSTPNNSESSRVIRIELSYGSKSFGFNVNQEGATVTWDYTFNIMYPSNKVLNTVAKPIDLDTIVVESYRTKLLNGTTTSTREYVAVTVDTIEDPWLEVTELSHDMTQVELGVRCLENTVSSIRSTTITIRQVGTSDLDQVDINQAAATITTRDFIDYVEPIPSGDLGPGAGTYEITLTSYQETLINGTVSSKVAVLPTATLNLDSGVGYATVRLVSGNPLNYEYTAELSIQSNPSSSTRGGHIMFKNGTAEVENAWYFTQDGSTVEYTYDIYWALSDRGNEPIKRVTSYTLDPAGEADRVHLILLCDRVTKINGIETSRTPISTGASNLNNYGPVYTRESDGEPASLIEDDGGINGSISSNIFPGQDYSNRGSTYQLVIGSLPNEDIYQQTIIMTYNRDVMDGSTAVGKVPAFYWTIDPIPYTRVFVFNWKNQTSLISNITLSGDIMDSGSVTSRDIISYASLRRNNVEFAKKYIKPTFIPPSEDWLQVIDNGQNADNTYNYAIRALTDNEGESARSQSVRFEQSGNGNQALQAYVSQDPMATEMLTCELGNYYGYNDSTQVNMGFGWSSKDGADSTGPGGMQTAGGYLGARIELPAGNDTIDMSAIGIPTSGKPLKIRLNNIRKEKEGGYGSDNQYTGLSVGYSQQDYQLAIVMGDGMSNYFTLTPEILSASGDYGGGIRIQVTSKATYNGYNGDSIADITLTPKDSNLPTLYLNIAWGNP